MTYSKGPWIYDAESGEIHTKDRTGFWGPDHDPVVVATVEQLDGVNNGPLLAAAEEMYKALNSMVLQFGYDVVHPHGLVHDEHEAIRSAMLALYKAEGKQ